MKHRIAFLLFILAAGALLMGQSSTWPGSRVTITGTTGANLQDALDSGEIGRRQSGAGPPTTETCEDEREVYIDTTADELYICSDPGTDTWKKTGAGDVCDHTDVDCGTPPVLNDTLIFDGNNWVPSAASINDPTTFDDLDIAFMRRSNVPGNLPPCGTGADQSTLKCVYVSPDIGGSIAIVGSTGGAGTLGDPLGTFADFQAFFTSPTGCNATRCRGLFDHGDLWRNGAINQGINVIANGSPTDIALVLGPYPEHERMEIDTIVRSSNRDPVQGVADGGDTTSTITDPALSFLTANELDPYFVVILSDTLGTGPAVGEWRSIASHDLSGEITVDTPFSAAPNTGTAFAVMTELSPTGTRVMFKMASDLKGELFIYGMDYKNCYGNSCVNLNSKNPAAAVTLWHVSFINPLPAEQSIDAAFHCNFDELCAMIVSGCFQSKRRCVYSSGNGFHVDHFVSSSESLVPILFHDAVEGHALAEFYTKIIENNRTSDIILSQKTGPGAVAAGDPQLNYWANVRSSYIGNGVGASSYATSWSSSLATGSDAAQLEWHGVRTFNTAAAMTTNFSGGDGTLKRIKIRGSTFIGGTRDSSGCSFVNFNNENGTQWDVTDSLVRVEDCPQFIRWGAFSYATLAAARTGFAGDPDVDCIGSSPEDSDCSVGFFSGTFTGRNAAVSFTLPEVLRVSPYWLPGGDTPVDVSLAAQ